MHVHACACVGAKPLDHVVNTCILEAKSKMNTTKVMQGAGHASKTKHQGPKRTRSQADGNAMQNDRLQTGKTEGAREDNGHTQKAADVNPTAQDQTLTPKNQNATAQELKTHTGEFMETKLNMLRADCAST